MKILALSGSLRQSSSNLAVLEAVAELAPPYACVEIFLGIADIPPFNPDHDVDPAPPSVKRFRVSVAAADAVLISSPEYAHGIPGALKNALDWTVSSGEFSEKPVALVNASPLSSYVTQALADVLSAMNTRLDANPAIQLPILPKPLTKQILLADNQLSALLLAFIQRLASARDS